MKIIIFFLLALIVLLTLLIFIKNKNIVNFEKFENTALSCNQENKFMNNKIHFISYGDKKFIKAKHRIYNEAFNTKWFYSIKCYGFEDLSISFRNEFKSVLSMERGGGYWIWKFYIILNKLETINEGDFLIYADSGCTINVNGIKRLEEYIEIIKNSTNKNKIISFQMGNKENVWTTKQVFDLFGVPENDPIETSGQYSACILIMQKCDPVINIFKTCLDKIRKDPLIITDHYNSNQKKKCFKENRHDQSVLSLARKIQGSIVIPNDTETHDLNSGVPFLATRKR